MENTGSDADFRGRVEKLESLLREIETHADPAFRSQAIEAVQTLMEYHSAGLSKILQHISDSGPTGQGIIAKMAGDELVSSLLLLYGLHPDDLESRIRQAIEQATTIVRKLGGQVELVSIDDGTVRVRVEPGGHSCQSTAGKMKAAVENAIIDLAPEVKGIVVEGLDAPGASPGFVPLEQVLNRHHSIRGDPSHCGPIDRRMPEMPLA